MSVMDTNTTTTTNQTAERIGKLDTYVESMRYRNDEDKGTWIFARRMVDDIVRAADDIIRHAGDIDVAQQCLQRELLRGRDISTYVSTIQMRADLLAAAHAKYGQNLTCLRGLIHHCVSADQAHALFD